MKIKVCGMNNPENILELAKLPIDFIGLIFYTKSPRYINTLIPESVISLPENIQKVGVFVNEDFNRISEMVKKYGLSKLQLHGNESPDFCLKCRNLTGIEIIKAFSISNSSDFNNVENYIGVCDYFLFDTKTSQHGGSGKKFDWDLLNFYSGSTPFFLSGGISYDDINDIKNISHSKLFGIDVNSRFELQPGLKNIKLLIDFIKYFKYEPN